MATNFPTSLDSYVAVADNVDDVMAADINNPRDAIEALEAKVGIDSSAVTGSLDYKVNKFFTAGRKLYLYENVAPTGWSIAAVTDKVLAVKGGSNAYNVNGGNIAGTWTQPDHTLIIAEMPAHTHTSPTKGTISGASGWLMGGAGANMGTWTSASTGGGGAHNHGTIHRPYAAVGIIAEKD